MENGETGIRTTPPRTTLSALIGDLHFPFSTFYFPFSGEGMSPTLPSCVGRWVTSIVVLLIAAGGCSTAHIDWPDRPMLKTERNGDTLVSYDMNGSGKPDYVQRMCHGRKTVLYFDNDRDGQTDEEVRLAPGDPDWPHYLIVLDGVPYRVVAKLWDEGRFRLFPRPSRVISTFPSMTDLALARLFDTPPGVAIEASYYDKKAHRLSNALKTYNQGLNAPWLDVLTYHAPQSIGARAYLDPGGVFGLELREMRAAFDRVETGFASAYSVGTAGLGTRGGEAAIRKYLEMVDRFCERLVYDRRGRVRLTLVADHGHNLTPSERIGFKRHLAKHGFRLANTLRSPKDVVSVKYGLVTYAQFFTSQPAEVASALLAHPAAELAVYHEGDAVVVLSTNGRAQIARRGGGYVYMTEPSTSGVNGDPLKLAPIIAILRDKGQVSEDGLIDDDALFKATAEHVYPDPLHRLWTCFNGLMQKPPDVIVSLRDGYCHGFWMFEYGIGKVASTHGSLNRSNSVTFAMSTVGPLPEVMRIEHVLPAVLNGTMERSKACSKRCRAPGAHAVADTVNPQGVAN